MLESAIIIILQTREVRCNIGGISDRRERKRELTPAARRSHRRMKMKCPVYQTAEEKDEQERNGLLVTGRSMLIG